MKLYDCGLQVRQSSDVLMQYVVLAPFDVHNKRVETQRVLTLKIFYAQYRDFDAVMRELIAIHHKADRYSCLSCARQNAMFDLKMACIEFAITLKDWDHARVSLNDYMAAWL